MQGSRAGVSEVRRRGVVILEDVLELPDVLREFLRGHGGVLDEGVGLRVAFEAHQQGDRGLPELPDLRLVFLGVGFEHVEGVAPVEEVIVRLRYRGLEIVDEFRVELDHQRRFRFLGDGFGVLGEAVGLGGEPEDLVVHELDRAHVVLEGLWHRGERIDQVIEEIQGKRGLLGRRDQRDGGLDDRSQGTFAADEELREIDDLLAGVVLVDDLMQIIARDRPLETGVLLIDLVLILLDEPAGRAVDPGFEIAFPDDLLVFGRVEFDLPSVDQRAVREHDPQFLGVGVGDAITHRVRAGAIVPDTAADRRAIRGGRVGRELQSVFLEGAVEVVLNDARLDGCPFCPRIDPEDRVHIPGRIEDDTARTDGLAAERGAGAPRHDRHLVVGSDLDRRADVGGVLGADHAGRAGLINAAVGGIEHLCVLVEAHLARDRLAQVGSERGVLLDVGVVILVAHRIDGGIQVYRVVVPVFDGHIPDPT